MGEIVGVVLGHGLGVHICEDGSFRYLRSNGDRITPDEGSNIRARWTWRQQEDARIKLENVTEEDREMTA